MIFTLRQARAISTGRMTQVHVPGVDGRACPVRIGHTYSVSAYSKRGLETFGRMRVVSRTRRRCEQITQKEARAQGGVKTTDAWKIEWVRRHDAAWVRDNQEKHADDLEHILLERFRRRHATRNVWVLGIELVAETPRFLAHPGPNQCDYTDSHARAFDDLEVVDAETSDAFAKRAAEEGERRRASFRRDLELARAEQKRLSSTPAMSNRTLRHINDAADRAGKKDDAA